jgi:predicted O-methyltransferase YrrM
MKRNDRLTVPMTVKWEHKKHTRRHFLEHLITINNFTSMIEVGVRRGGTLFHLLDKIPNLIVYAIDTDIKQFYNDGVKEKYGHRLIPMQGYSEVLADKIQDNSVDLVFIDANHSYEYVYKDIVKYSPKLKPTGLLTGHDIDYPGVNRAVKELVQQFDVGPNNVWVKI